jgi:hypothetical protein
MIAPFAFLGRAYHDRLCKLYTTITPADILKARGLTAVLTSDALADTDPLYRLISRYVDEQMLADIATEYGKGRLLLIGTTSLDFQRPVIWNIGAIAAKGGPSSGRTRAQDTPRVSGDSRCVPTGHDSGRSGWRAIPGNER